MWVSRPLLLSRTYGCRMPGLPEKWAQGSGDLEFGRNLIPLRIQQERAEHSRKRGVSRWPGYRLYSVTANLPRWSPTFLSPLHVLATLHIRRQNLCPLHLNPSWPSDCVDPQHCLFLKFSLLETTCHTVRSPSCMERPFVRKSKCSGVGAPDELTADSQYQCHPYTWAILDIATLSPRSRELPAVITWNGKTTQPNPPTYRITKAAAALLLPRGHLSFSEGPL